MSSNREAFKDGELVNSVGKLSDQAKQRSLPGHASTTGAYLEKPLPPLPSNVGRDEASLASSHIKSQHVVDASTGIGATSVPIATSNISSSGNVGDRSYDRHNKQEIDSQTRKKNHVPRDGSPTRETFERIVGRDKEPSYASYKSEGPVATQTAAYAARSSDHKHDRHKDDKKSSERQTHVPRDGSPTRETFEAMVHRDKEPEYVPSHTQHGHSIRPSAGIQGAGYADQRNRADNNDKSSSQNFVVDDGNPDREHFERMAQRDRQPNLQSTVAGTQINVPNSRSNLEHVPVTSVTSESVARPLDSNLTGSKNPIHVDNLAKSDNSNTALRVTPDSSGVVDNSSTTAIVSGVEGKSPADYSRGSNNTPIGRDRHDAKFSAPVAGGILAAGAGAVAMGHKLKDGKGNAHDQSLESSRYGPAVSHEESKIHGGVGERFSTGTTGYHSREDYGSNTNNHSIQDSDYYSPIPSKDSSTYGSISEGNQQFATSNSTGRQFSENLSGQNDQSIQDSSHHGSTTPRNESGDYGGISKRANEGNFATSGSQQNEYSRSSIKDESSRQPIVVQQQSSEYSPGRTEYSQHGDDINAPVTDVSGGDRGVTDTTSNRYQEIVGKYDQQHQSNIPIAATAAAAGAGAGAAIVGTHSSKPKTENVNPLSSGVSRYENTADRNTSTVTREYEAPDFNQNQVNRDATAQPVAQPRHDYNANTGVGSTEYNTSYGETDTTTDYTNSAQDNSKWTSNQPRGESDWNDPVRSNEPDYSKFSNVTHRDNRKDIGETTQRAETSGHQAKPSTIIGAGIAAASTLAAGAAIVAHKKSEDTRDIANTTTDEYSQERSQYDSSASHRSQVNSSGNFATEKDDSAAGNQGQYGHSNADNPYDRSTQKLGGHSLNEASNATAYDSTQPHIGGTLHPTVGERSIGNVANNDPTGNLQSSLRYDEYSNQYRNEESWKSQNDKTGSSSGVPNIDRSANTTASNDFRNETSRDAKSSASIIGGSVVGAGIAGSAISRGEADRNTLDRTRQEKPQDEGTTEKSRLSDSNAQGAPYDPNLYSSGNILNPDSYTETSNTTTTTGRNLSSNQMSTSDTSDFKAQGSAAKGVVLGTGVAGLMDQHSHKVHNQPIENRLQDMNLNDPTFIGNSSNDITDIPVYDNLHGARDLNESGPAYEHRVRESVGYDESKEHSRFSDTASNRIHGAAQPQLDATHPQRMPGDFPEETYISRDKHPSSFGGILEKVKGTVKESVGHMVGNERMALEGEMEKNSGQIMLDSARASKANQR
ncbi:hypothetical protein K493DRAFT_308399 [Basidiobolus meristosporus CBS 931.73]|uniref:CsbD-like domain-containing protein n=1 Tax=Basidiobolus meristosporus CBS 931.73 TaxID=1314790 RepID=A0A1Y1X4H9_9FUNG|nr:hypothetical protein K493DRAFT_308399 [Basidiobolus meristosporus CBS 931.73]|eukprot:ORX80224.1 hypothetical protein K493DRAFT_308399 [Basidiobolus meristosporus CBS 931.73]